MKNLFIEKIVRKNNLNFFGIHFFSNSSIAYNLQNTIVPPTNNSLYYIVPIL